MIATEEACSVNVGVGGTPQIKILRQGEIITPNVYNSKLASEIVLGTRAGYLPGEFQRDALTALLYEGADYRTIDEKMWQHAGEHQDQLRQMLRGYPVPN